MVEGVISYGSRHDCEFSRSYLVLVSSERGFIDRALATPATKWNTLRDLPPRAAVKAIRRHLDQPGVLALRVDDDRSSHSRVAISFYTRGGKRLSGAYPQRHHEWLGAVQPQEPHDGVLGLRLRAGADATKKQSNIACATNVVK